MARVLLIEDDEEIAALLERYLRRMGHLVVRAMDGVAGVKTFTDGRFELVISDTLLPKRSGFDVVTDIRAMAHGADCGIIMMSASFRGPQARRDAEARGADAFFVKPFVLGELKKKVEELLLKAKVNETPRAPTTGKTDIASAQKPASPNANDITGVRRLNIGSGSGPAVPAPAPPSRTTTPQPQSKPPAMRSAEGEPAEFFVQSPLESAAVLLRCARSGFTGVVNWLDGASKLDVLFVRGVAVGASDNLRDNLLGERMWRQRQLTTEQMREAHQRVRERGERFAEALLALGFCTADEAYRHVEQQAVARVRRALAWTGTATLVPQALDTTDARVSAAIEMLDVILGFAFEDAQRPFAHAFVNANGRTHVEKHPRFDEMLLAFARVRPQSTLPMLLMQQAPTVEDCARAAGVLDVYAAHLSGMVRLPTDAPADARPLPDVLRTVSSSQLMDRPAATLVCETLLRARGRNYYELAGMGRDAPRAEVLRALTDLSIRVGPTTLGRVPLGPAVAAARELWAILDDATNSFNDDAARANYDAGLQPVRAPAVQTAPLLTEDLYLQGQQALADGDLDRALTCFSQATQQKPEDPDYASYFGWAQILTGAPDKGIRALMLAQRAHPQAMRPLFFLGLNAAREGDAARARALLQECSRRCPDDVEVAITLSALDG